MDRLQRQFAEGKDAFGTLAQRDAASAESWAVPPASPPTASPCREFHCRSSTASPLSLQECRAGKEAMTLALVRRLQRVAQLQGKLLQRKKRWDALLDVSRSAPRTNRTRLVRPPVLARHVSSLPPYQPEPLPCDTSCIPLQPSARRMSVLRGPWSAHGEASRARPHPRAQRVRPARRRLSPRRRVERKRLFGDLETVLRLPETYKVRLRSPY
jgi:hypothetical protein